MWHILLFYAICNFLGAYRNRYTTGCHCFYWRTNYSVSYWRTPNSSSDITCWGVGFTGCTHTFYHKKGNICVLAASLPHSTSNMEFRYAKITQSCHYMRFGILTISAGEKREKSWEKPSKDTVRTMESERLAFHSKDGRNGKESVGNC